MWLLSRFASRLPLDIPNNRSLHERVVPRIGGVAILMSAVPSLGYLWSSAIALIAAALATLSFVDDKKGLPIGLRFVAHGAAALALAIWLKPALSYPALACVVLATWWMTNLYNFMDGSDGLAGGMAVFGFGAYAIAAYLAGDIAFALAASSVTTTAAVFLIFNFPPARVFMGDAGSIPTGFLALAMGSYGYASGYWGAWFPFVVFSPFIFDATLVLLRRMLIGEKFWTAHRSHYYQRLVQMGLGHRKTALAEYALMLGCAVAALGLRNASSSLQIVGLCALTALYLALALSIDRAWKRFKETNA